MRAIKFTIHFATINTAKGRNQLVKKLHLQYTLLLLILNYKNILLIEEKNLQYTLLLLIL